MKPVLLFGAAGASGAVEALTKAPPGKDGKLSASMREKIGEVGSKHREDMPADAFLLGAERKYPVKVKEDGGWKYSPDLLLAAARRARMEGRDDLAAEADKIRARIGGGGGSSTEKQMTKSILLFGAPGASESIEALTKAHVQGYTRSDGTYVQEHEDSRQQVAFHEAQAKHHEAARDEAKSAGDRTAETKHENARAAHSKAAEMHAKGSPKAGAYSSDAKEASDAANAKPSASKPKHSTATLGVLADQHAAEADRHDKMADKKGVNHPDYDHHVKASALHSRAQYYAEKARDAANDEDRAGHLVQHAIVKDKIAKTEAKISDKQAAQDDPIAHHNAMKEKHEAAADQARKKGDHDLADRHQDAAFQHEFAAGRHEKKRPDADQISRIANNLSESLKMK